jgi:hypothetical protein
LGGRGLGGRGEGDLLAGYLEIRGKFIESAMRFRFHTIPTITNRITAC